MKALTAAKMRIKDYVSVYRISKTRFVFHLLTFFNIIFLLPLLIMPRELLLKMYKAFMSSLAKFGFHSLHAVVFRISPALSAIAFLYIFFNSSNTLKLSEKEMFIAIHPLSLAEVLFSRVAYWTFIYLSLLSPYIIILYLGTYISGYYFSPILAFLILLLATLTFAILAELGSLLNYYGFRWVWLALALLSAFDYFRGTLTISYLTYLPLVSILNCYTNLNILPAFLEIFAAFVLFYIVSNSVNPDLEEVRVLRKVKTKKVSKSVREITPLRKVLIELERSIIPYLIIATLVSAVSAVLFRNEIAHISHSLANLFLFYSLFFAMGVVEGFASIEASNLWFYRVSSSERSYAFASITGEIILTVGIVLPVSIFFYPAIGTLAFCILAASMIIPPYFTLITTYLCSRTKMKVTRMLHAKRELEDVRLLILLLEVPLIALLAFFVFVLPWFSIVLVLTPFLLVPLIEKCAKNIEIV